jgi:chemotaxis protein CheD
VFLAPGELIVRSEPTCVKTIVGSCVAVCLWDSAAGVGGVNHFLLPAPGPNDPPDDRHCSVATPRLVDELVRAGGDMERTVASVVGGGHPVSAIRTGAVGDANVDAAISVLGQRGIGIVRQETGGAHGRKLLFNTSTGELIVREVRGWQAAAPVDAEP